MKAQSTEESKVCIACGRVDDDYYISLGGVGPFCHECWSDLTDADQSLLLEKRLEKMEEYIARLVRYEIP